MTTSRPPVRLGLAGCGNVLGAYLAQAARLRHQGLAEVAVLCGRERQRASALAGWPTAGRQPGLDFGAIRCGNTSSSASTVELAQASPRSSSDALVWRVFMSGASGLVLSASTRVDTLLDTETGKQGERPGGQRTPSRLLTFVRHDSRPHTRVMVALVALDTRDYERARALEGLLEIR